jgi:hypothetical protein
MESAAAGDDVVILAVLPIFDGNVNILARLILRLGNLDRKPALDDLG